MIKIFTFYIINIKLKIIINNINYIVLQKFIFNIINKL